MSMTFLDPEALGLYFENFPIDTAFIFLTAKEQFKKGLCQLVNQRKFFHIVMHLSSVPVR